MKKVGLLLICLILTILPCVAKGSSNEASDAPKVFVYHIPDEEETESEKSDVVESSTPEDITSDDVTADTSAPEEEEIVEEESEDYELSDMYTDVLQGYAVYDEEELVSLEDDIKDFQELNIKTPSRVEAIKFNNAQKISIFDYNKYSKFNNMEYSIAPVSTKNSKSFGGGFSAGTTYFQGIDYSELEQSTGVFSRYDSKYFAISTSYAKTVNSTNNNYNDNFYFSPELKINQYFTLKETLSADITKNRKKAEVVLSINPFGFKDSDRLRFDIGVNATYDDTNTLLKNQFKFSTNIKM
jgi:hypothetical protein